MKFPSISNSSVETIWRERPKNSDKHVIQKKMWTAASHVFTENWTRVSAVNSQYLQVWAIIRLLWSKPPYAFVWNYVQDNGLISTSLAVKRELNQNVQHQVNITRHFHAQFATDSTERTAKVQERHWLWVNRFWRSQFTELVQPLLSEVRGTAVQVKHGDTARTASPSYAVSGALNTPDSHSEDDSTSSRGRFYFLEKGP